MDFSQSLSSIPDRFPVKVFPEIGVTVTGDLLRRNSALCAAWLQGQGCEAIGIHMANCPEFLYLFAGALRAGVKVTLFNVLGKAETDLPLFDRGTVAGLLGQPHPAPAVFTPYDWKWDEPFLTLSTSGTSGKKKLLEKDLKGMLGRLGRRPAAKTLVKALRIRLYNCSPWYHNTGVFMLLLSLCGFLFTEITAERFNPDHMRQSLNATRPNLILTTPTMLIRSVDCGEIRLPSFIVCTGEYLSDRAIARLEEAGGGQLLYNSYGTTETEGISHLTYVFDGVKLSGRVVCFLMHLSGVRGALFTKKTLLPHCAGSLYRGADVKIMKDGRELGEGETGEIHVRTRRMNASLAHGYYNSGDTGYKKDGLLFISGRQFNLINRSGEKILPAEIEQPISGLAGVKSVLAFGIPSETHGEDICVAIESDGGAAVVGPSDLDGLLPKHMMPQHLVFFEKFPLTGSGKTDISAIRAFLLPED